MKQNKYLIIHLMPFLHFGGGRAVVNVIKELSEYGGISQILVTNGEIDDLYDDVTFLNEVSDCIEERITTDIFKRDIKKLANASMKIGNIVEQNCRKAAGMKVIFHANTGMSCYCALVAAKMLEGIADCRVVSTLMGGSHDKPDSYKAMDARVLNQADLLLPISNSVKSLLIAEGVNETLMKVHYCGLYLDEISAEAVTKKEARDLLGLPVEATIVGTVSQLSPRKGVDAMLRAFSMVAAQREDALLMLVGKGHEDVDINSLASELGIRDRVRRFGHVRNQYMAICAMDVVAMTSRFEGLGLLLVEAQTLCRPVVSFATGGTPETIIDGETGFLVPHGDDNALADRIVTLLSNIELYGRMGKRAGEWVCEKFDIRANTKTLVDIYRSLFL